MTFLERIKNELFVKECNLVENKNAYYYGKSTSNNEVFYFMHEFGYVIYLPKIGVNTKNVFDPINPTSFDWHMFNNQIIFIPTSNMPFKTIFKLHPDLDDYIVRFNLEFLKKFKSVWVETDNEKIEFYFLMRNQKVKLLKNDEEDEVLEETELLLKNVAVMPEFQRSNTINKSISQKNIDDVWQHWLLMEHGYSITNEQYHRNYKNDEWISKVLGELIVNNLTTKEEKIELDPDLRRLLGMEPEPIRRYNI